MFLLTSYVISLCYVKYMTQFDNSVMQYWYAWDIAITILCLSDLVDLSDRYVV